MSYVEHKFPNNIGVRTLLFISLPNVRRVEEPPQEIGPFPVAVLEGNVYRVFSDRDCIYNDTLENHAKQFEYMF